MRLLKETYIEQSDKLIFKAGYILFVLHIFSALMIASVFRDMFSDFNTVMYWIEELMKSANSTFAIGITGSFFLKIVK